MIELTYPINGVNLSLRMRVDLARVSVFACLLLGQLSFLTSCVEDTGERFDFDSWTKSSATGVSLGVPRRPAVPEKYWSTSRFEVNRASDGSHQIYRACPEVSGMQRVDQIVLHVCQGSCYSEFERSGGRRVSAHFVVENSRYGGVPGRITEVVPITHGAWHSGNRMVNCRSIGIEHQGHEHDASLEQATVEAGALLVATLSRLLGIRVVHNPDLHWREVGAGADRVSIKLHRQASATLCPKPWNHTDFFSRVDMAMRREVPFSITAPQFSAPLDKCGADMDAETPRGDNVRLVTSNDLLGCCEQLLGHDAYNAIVQPNHYFAVCHRDEMNRHTMFQCGRIVNQHGGVESAVSSLYPCQDSSQCGAIGGNASSGFFCDQ